MKDLYFLQLLDYTIKIELFGDVNIYLGIGIKIFCAILLGTIIGLDREKKLKTAGVKTQILICLGATLYVTISQLTLHTDNGSIANVDPNRVAAQVVSGIGFLGAGTILHSRGAVYGMTTAATIWVVAAMGVAIGNGFIFSATLFCLTTLIVLNLIEPFVRLIQPERHFFIEITGKNGITNDVARMLSHQDFQIISKENFSNDAHDKENIQLHIRGTYHELKKFTQSVRSNKKLEQITYNIIRDNHVA